MESEYTVFMPEDAPVLKRRLSDCSHNEYYITPFILHDTVEEMSLEFTMEGESGIILFLFPVHAQLSVKNIT